MKQARESPRPPNWTIWVIKCCAIPGHREEILGDVLENYATTYVFEGEGKARKYVMKKAREQVLLGLPRQLLRIGFVAVAVDRIFTVWDKLVK